ncbi:substrate-binding domain-containing protein [Tropicimonas sp.]|uniref:substrate-binding domain-containing protein n=1 Tax=Tropicimonas sp. TaxID=2067044 RepID=UPI003A858E71
MRTVLFSGSVIALLAGGLHAETVGVSMQSFNDNFQTLLRHGIIDRAEELGLEIQVEDSDRDVGKQLNQVSNFLASGVDGIIVTLADTSAAPGITQAAETAGTPLVYVNMTPVNVDNLPDDEVYVGSDELEAGRLGAEEACRILREQGRTEAGAYILMGDLAHDGATKRTQAVRDVLGTDECSFITIVDAQSALWLRTTALDVMTNWLTTGASFDVVFANNDEMAIGAIQAMRSAGIDKDEVIVVGVDATQDGLAAMAAGELDVTAFQNVHGQATGAVDALVALTKGEDIARITHIPFELVIPENMDAYSGKN